MTNFDHYTEARELASLLRKENLDDFATSLIRAMEEGATGTEIFMALRWNIERLLRANKCSDPDFAQKIGYRLSKNKESIGRISRENEPFPLTVFRPSEA